MPQGAATKSTRLGKVWADGAYAGQLIDWTSRECGWELEIVKRSDQAQGFELLPRCWVVQRTRSWISNYRRLSNDYEEVFFHRKSSREFSSQGH